MADIDQILAGGAGASTRANFAPLSTLLDSYYKGQDQAYQQQGRNLFQGGVPTIPDGQPGAGQLDLPAITKALFQHGDIANGAALIGASAGAQDRALLAGLDGQPSQNAPPISPSASRTNGVADPSIRPSNGARPNGGQQAPDTSTTGTPTSATLAQILAAQNIPNDQISGASASLARQIGLDDPTQPFNPQDPKIRNVLVPAVQQLKRMGIGQVVQGQPPEPQQVAQAAPQQQQSFQPSQAQVAAQNDPILQRLSFLAASPDKQVAAAAKVRLESYLKNSEPTPDMKNAAASGMNLPAYQEKQGDLAAQQAGATEQAKAYVAKYNNINEAGDKAVSEIPKLKLALKQMDDPNYYSGPLNQYNLGGKRLVAALGGDPDKAAPQEIVNKITADSILSGMGALKGLGPIRVAEMKILGQASMSPDNSIQAQKFLASMAIRVQERVAKVSDIAQNYNDGVLDTGFDRKIRAMDKAEPLFSQSEIDRFQNIIQGKEKATSGTQPSATTLKFNSPSEVHAALAAGKIKKGDTFTDANGVPRIIP